MVMRQGYNSDYAVLGATMFNQLKAAVITKLDKRFPPLPQAAPIAPKRRQSTPRPRTATQRRQATTPTVTYEQWKRGKRGRGEKVRAPRGKGREWADRFYCEQTIERATDWQQSNRTTKKYRAGSYNDRRRQRAYRDRYTAWGKAMAPAKAIIEPEIPDWADSAAWWQLRKEVVKDCLEYATYLLDMVR